MSTKSDVKNTKMSTNKQNDTHEKTKRNGTPKTSINKIFLKIFYNYQQVMQVVIHLYFYNQ